MYTPYQNRFRRDLVIAAAHKRGQDSDQLVWVKDPRTGKLFSLRPDEYFLCLAMDGVATPEAIAVASQEHFQRPVSAQAVLAFSKQMHRLGLLEHCPVEQGESPPALAHEAAEKPTDSLPSTKDTLRTLNQSLVGTRLKSQPRSAPQTPEFSVWLWSAPQPIALLARLARLFAPLRGVLKLMAISLIVLFPVALFTVARHHVWLSNDLKYYINGNFTNLIIVLVASGVQRSLAKLALGAVASTYGNAVQKLGFGLFLGMLPTFLISLNERRFSRQQKIQIHGTSILVRLFLLSVAVFVWHSSYGRYTSLTPLSIVFMLTGFFGLLLDAIPLWPGDGYYFLIAKLGLSDIFGRSYQIWTMVLQKQPLPRSLNRREQFGLQAMGLIGLSALVATVFLSIFLYSIGLAQDFASNILGNAAEFVLIGSMSAIFIYKLIGVWSIMRSVDDRPVPKPREGQEDLAPTPRVGAFNVDWSRFLNRSFLKPIGLGLATVLVLLIPYQFRPGGQITIMPQKEQKIEVPVAGKVVKVFSQDQDDELIKGGTVIATLESTDLDSNLREIQQQIIGQHSTIEGLRAKVDENKQQLQTYVDQARLSASKYEREFQLYKEGVYSLSSTEDAERQATTDKNNVLTQSKVIEGALHDVARAKADLAKQRQQESYLRSQLQRTNLRMPFDGYLVTTKLNRKVGTYLNPGDTFATAKVAGKAFVGEILVPESENDQVMLGRAVEVKLFAFPQNPIRGQVISVNPAALTNETTGSVSTVPESGTDVQVVEEAAGKVVKVTVKIRPEPGIQIKTGMTGRAKIDGQTMPLVLVFSRALVRFVTVEMWSWLP
jgi:putative peptide zinc metalloprotease protein